MMKNRMRLLFLWKNLPLTAEMRSNSTPSLKLIANSFPQHHKWGGFNSILLYLMDIRCNILQLFSYAKTKCSGGK